MDMFDSLGLETNERAYRSQNVLGYLRECLDNDKTVVCPYCKGLIGNSNIHISHVYPVAHFGDRRPIRMLVVMHADCNEQLHANQLYFDKDDGKNYAWSYF